MRQESKTFQTFPNQKVIHIESLMDIQDDELYLKVNQDALQMAMINLTTMGSLKLWLYFSRHCENHTFALSAKDCESWGLTTATYKSSVNKLIEMGYLVQRREGSNVYNFIQCP